MSSRVLSIDHATQAVSIYLGIPILAAGLLGNILCVIIFTSRHTFRPKPCSVFLLSISLVNIGQLLTDFLPKIMFNGFDFQWIHNSLFFCKFLPWFIQTCTLVSWSCMCWAVIDQYVVTCIRPCAQHMSSIRIARRLVILTCIIGLLHGIPFAVTSNIRNGCCTFYNQTFVQYYSKFYFPILIGLLPIMIMNLFSLLTSSNIRRMAKRQVPIIRGQLDQQLTTMVFVQVIVTTVTTIPFIGYHTYMLNVNFLNSMVITKQQLISTILACLYFVNYSAPFYIYCCSSIRFRKQLYCVLAKMNLRRCRRTVSSNAEMDTYHPSVGPLSTIENIIFHLQ